MYLMRLKSRMRLTIGRGVHLLMKRLQEESLKVLLTKVPMGQI